MPYIEACDREFLHEHLKKLSQYEFTPGELNYIITSIIHNWIQTMGLCYGNINAVIGVLECAKLELYRQVAAPYEDIKKTENGNISELDNGENK